jgi:hypothetical protein
MHDALRRLHRALARLTAALLLAALCACSTGGDAAQEVPAAPPPASAPGPVVNPWTVRSEETLAIELGAAQTSAAARGKRVLLVFLAFRDPDSEAVVRALSASPARNVLAERYVPVYVNVGRDGTGQTRLRHAHDVRALATLVVLDATGRRVARQTFAPVTDVRPLSSATLAEWLEAPRGR